MQENKLYNWAIIEQDHKQWKSEIGFFFLPLSLSQLFTKRHVYTLDFALCRTLNVFTASKVKDGSGRRSFSQRLTSI